MPSPLDSRPTLAFIGGTGPEGRGLALRFALAGYTAVIGSRSAERAEGIAREIASGRGAVNVEGRSNEMAASAGDIIFLTVPHRGLRDTLPPLAQQLAEKIVVSAVAPVEFVEGRPVAARLEAGSAAQEVQTLLPNSRVVSAFQTVDAHQLGDPSIVPDSDVIVCSDDVEARRAIVRLVGAIPNLRGLSGGRLAASRYVEEITALLITLNGIYGSHAGVRFTGIDR